MSCGRGPLSLYCLGAPVCCESLTALAQPQPRALLSGRNVKGRPALFLVCPAALPWNEQPWRAPRLPSAWPLTVLLHPPLLGPRASRFSRPHSPRPRLASVGSPRATSHRLALAHACPSAGTLVSYSSLTFRHYLGFGFDITFSSEMSFSVHLFKEN